MFKKTLLIILVSLGCQLSFAQNWDISTLRSINVDRNTSLDGAYRTISNTTLPIVVGVPMVMFGIGFLQHDSITKNRALYIGGSVIIAGAVSELSKQIFKRNRPFVTYPDIQDLEGSASGYSFPSGHTSVAFGLATSVSIAYPKWYIIVPSFLWACEVGYSRLHLGVHYPTDIIAGAFVGAGSTFLSHEVNRWLFHPNRRMLRN